MATAMRSDPKTIAEADAQYRYWQKLKPKTQAQARKRAFCISKLEKLLCSSTTRTKSGA